MRLSKELTFIQVILGIFGNCNWYHTRIGEGQGHINDFRLKKVIGKSKLSNNV